MTGIILFDRFVSRSYFYGLDMALTQLENELADKVARLQYDNDKMAVNARVWRSVAYDYKHKIDDANECPVHPQVTQADIRDAFNIRHLDIENEYRRDNVYNRPTGIEDCLIKREAAALIKEKKYEEDDKRVGEILEVMRADKIRKELERETPVDEAGVQTLLAYEMDQINKEKAAMNRLNTTNKVRPINLRKHADIIDVDI